MTRLGTQEEFDVNHERIQKYVHKFVAGAIETLLWAEVSVECGVEECVYNGQSFDARGDWELSEDDVDQVTGVCEDFIFTNLDVLFTLDPEQCGHDFVLTKGHHGAGFWDRGLGEIGDSLTDAASPYGESLVMCPCPAHSLATDTCTLQQF